MLHYGAKEREVCWDKSFVDSFENVEIEQGKPVRREKVFTCDAPWEGNFCCFMHVMKVDDKVRMYYSGYEYGEDFPSFFCVAEGKDGRSFERLKLHKYAHKVYEAKPSSFQTNNIFFHKLPEYHDNFSVFYDENPNCPADEKFKALGLYEEKIDGVRQPPRLHWSKSSNGIDFEDMGYIDIVGIFDTYNVVIWDKETEQYFLYTRHYHHPDGTECHWKRTSMISDIREIRVSVSKDFRNWTQLGPIQFPEGTEDINLYTNQVQKYYRAKNVFLGMPVRYVDRAKDIHNFKHLTLGWDDTREKLLENGGRLGTALTDCVLMTSRDGFHFERSEEPFFENTLQNEHNWMYGDGYAHYGMIETPSDVMGEPNEISLYMRENCMVKATDVVRYTIRLDGFYCFKAGKQGGTVLTKPFTFDGSGLQINFSTSIFGHLRIKVCDENGREIEGYDSNVVFGNSVDRKVDFEKPLSALNGKCVRLKIEMKEAKLYSFMFE